MTNKNAIVIAKNKCFLLWNVNSYRMPINSIFNIQLFKQVKSPKIIHINFDQKYDLINYRTIMASRGISNEDIALMSIHNIDKYKFYGLENLFVNLQRDEQAV